MGFSLVVREGAAPLAVCGFLIALRLLLWNTGPRVRGLQELQHVGSVVMHGVSFSTACGIFPDQGLNPCLLHWQADSLPLSHQRSPHVHIYKTLIELLLNARPQLGTLSLDASLPGEHPLGLHLPWRPFVGFPIGGAILQQS